MSDEQYHSATHSTIDSAHAVDQDGGSAFILPPELASDRYQIVEQLDRGGTGVVYKAKDLKLPRTVALKVLRNRHAQSKPMLAHFAYEAAIMSYLAHPGVVPIYDSGHCTDGRPFHVMKLILGSSLGGTLNAARPKRSTLLGIFANVCHTIAFAHEQGVVHLDLKPGNILIGAFGNVLVTDWGLSRFTVNTPASVAEIVSELPEADSIEGTPQYMSPEQAQAIDVDERTDVFGLGAILCEILTGRPPYQTDSKLRMLQEAASGNLEEAFALLDQSEADLPLVRLAKKCLSPDANDRPSSALHVASAVSNYQASALEQAEVDLQRFFELTLDLFCFANFDGYFVRINSNFQKVLGFSEQQLMAEPFISFVHPDDRENTLSQMSVLSEGQPVVRFRNRYRTASGDYVVMEWTSQSLVDEELVFAVARDVTADVS